MAIVPRKQHHKESQNTKARRGNSSAPCDQPGVLSQATQGGKRKRRRLKCIEKKMQIINKSMQSCHGDAGQNTGWGDAQGPTHHFHTSDLHNFKRLLTPRVGDTWSPHQRADYHFEKVI